MSGSCLLAGCTFHFGEWGNGGGGVTVEEGDAIGECFFFPREKVKIYGWKDRCI